VVARTSPATHRAAPAVEQAQGHAVAAQDVDQAVLGLVQLPARREEAAVLVAVGVAEHDLLQIAAGLHEVSVEGHRQQLLHAGSAAAEILDGLEEWHDVERQAWLLAGNEEADL